MRIDRTDPLDLDLDTADGLADVVTASEVADGLSFPAKAGPDLLTSRQLGTDSRPIDAMFVARDGDRVVGEATVDLPWRANTDSASVQVRVHPDVRRLGLGGALWRLALEVVDERGRKRVHTGGWQGGVGIDVLDHWGLDPDQRRRHPTHRRARHPALDLAEPVRRGGVPGRGLRAGAPGRQHPRRPDRGAGALHEAINDAPLDDPDDEPDAWDAQRLADYEGAMAGRRQTLYRVMARHRETGAWAGQSMLAFNEFTPAAAFQEDTSVVRTHRGHRLGLLMKTAMLTWITDERPELAQIDTWNDSTNHHMIAINERLGATVVARRQGFRADR